MFSGFIVVYTIGILKLFCCWVRKFYIVNFDVIWSTLFCAKFMNNPDVCYILFSCSSIEFLKLHTVACTIFRLRMKFIAILQSVCLIRSCTHSVYYLMISCVYWFHLQKTGEKLDLNWKKICQGFLQDIQLSCVLGIDLQKKNRSRNLTWAERKLVKVLFQKRYATFRCNSNLLKENWQEILPGLKETLSRLFFFSKKTYDLFQVQLIYWWQIYPLLKDIFLRFWMTRAIDYIYSMFFNSLNQCVPTCFTWTHSNKLHGILKALHYSWSILFYFFI